jgi:hypothetical protein
MEFVPYVRPREPYFLLIGQSTAAYSLPPRMRITVVFDAQDPDAVSISLKSNY